MPRSPDDFPSDIEALLESGRPIVPISDTKRARALARARAALLLPPPPIETDDASDDAFEQRTSWHANRWAAAAGFALMAAVAGGAAAYELGIHAPPSARVSPPPASVPKRVARPSEIIVLPEAAPTVEPPPAPVAPSRAALAREELQLLQRARRAMAGRDFAAALAPLAEHARRFKDGRLAEEREALRVKALAGLGRTREARRVLTTFEARFPRSPLVPALRHLIDSAS
jgi:hypothetical protein